MLSKGMFNPEETSASEICVLDGFFLYEHGIPSYNYRARVKN